MVTRWPELYSLCANYHTPLGLPAPSPTPPHAMCAPQETVAVVSAPTPPPEVEAIPSVESFVLSEPSLALNPIERKKGVYGASFLKKVIRDIQQVGCAVD